MLQAIDYARKHDLHALLISQHGELVHEEYAGGYDATRAHPIYSGTKSFWGICASLAQDDGILSLDEKIGDTIDAWKTDRVKAQVTVTQLLSMTAGIPFGGLGRAVPMFEKALDTPLVNKPGTTFTYSGIPLQVFGAFLSAKLRAQGQTPFEYLKTRILDPHSVQIAKWRTLSDGTHTMPTGAELTARSWLNYGLFLLKDGAAVQRCFEPNAVNPKYGLGFWLARAKDGTPLAAYASGSGKQALYVLPQHDVAIVHFAQSKSYNHETFLRRLVL